MKKVVCFSRVSSSAQDLDNQRTEVVKAIKADGFKDKEIVYVEGKESAIKKDEMERVTLNELKMVIKENPTITDVYFYAIDRLARKVSVVLSIVDQMTALSINLHFLNPYPMQTMRDGKEDSMGKMFLTFLSIGAEMEMKMKAERFETTRKAMKEKGQLIGGNVLYGYYRANSGYPVELEEEKKVVVDIFNWYVNEDMSMRQIAKKLICDNIWNMDNYKTLNSAIMKISKILSNPAYSGRQPKQYDSKEEKTIIYPALVDIELQDKAIAKASNNKKKKDTDNIYFAKGMVKTEVNDKYYTMSPIKGNCSYSLTYNGLQVGVNINVIDCIAWRTAQNLHRIYQSYENFVAPQHLEKSIEERNERIEKLNPTFKTFEQREERVNKLYTLGRLDDEQYESQYDEIQEEKKVYLNEKVKLENEIKRLKTQINKLKNMQDDDIDVSLFTDEEKRDLCKSMIDMIVVEKVGKFDYDIIIHPADIFKIGIVVPTYHYNCSGGVKRLTEIFGEQEYNITDEIVVRYTLPRRR